MTFDECLKYCIRHRYSHRISKHWILMNIGLVLVSATGVGFLYSLLLPDVSLIAIAMMAVVSGIIVWYGAMLEMALYLRKGIGDQSGKS